MARRKAGSVMECYELVSLILSSLETHRELAKCSSVSRLWRECSTVARASLPSSSNNPHLILRRDKHSSFYNLTSSKNIQRLPFPKLFSDNLHLELLASCKGLLLFKLGDRELVICEPIIGDWRLLPPAELEICAAALVRDEPECLEKTMLVIMDFYGRIDVFDSEKSCWVQKFSGCLDFIGEELKLVYHRGGLLSCFSDEDEDQRGIYWFSLENRSWSKVAEAGQRNHFFEWRDKVLFLSSDSIIEPLKISELDLKQGKLVEQAGLGEATGLMWLRSNSFDQFSVSGEELFQVDCSKKKILKFSLKDMSTTTLWEDLRYILDFSSIVCFRSDEGEAIYQFRKLQRLARTRECWSIEDCFID